MKELSEIQFRLKAPKNQFNNFGKYKYRSCEDILEAVKPLLHDYECTLTLTDELVFIPCEEFAHYPLTITKGDDLKVYGEREERKAGRIFIKATARLVNASGEVVEVSAFAEKESDKKGMDACQMTGAASSYARKYALNGLFCIDDTKDSDADANSIQTAIDEVLPEIEHAPSAARLMEIWNDCENLHNVKRFSSAMTKRKKELGL